MGNRRNRFSLKEGKENTGMVTGKENDKENAQSKAIQYTVCVSAVSVFIHVDFYFLWNL